MRKPLSILSLGRFIFFCAVLLLSSFPVPAFAQSDEDSRPALPSPSDFRPALQIGDFQDNNIIHYDGTKGGQCTAVGAKYTKDTSLPNLSGNDNAEKIWNYLIEQGFTEEQAAGVMGNIRQESNYDPDLEEGNGIGYGIVQWSFGRRTTLQQEAAKQNVPVSDLSFQLAFMKNEMQTLGLVNFNGLFEKYNTSAQENVWDLLKEQKTIEDAVIVFHDGFERSGDYTNYGGIDHRIKYAKEAYEKFSGKKAPGSAESVSCRTQSAAGSGDLQAMVLEYAHPEYHPNNSSGPVPPPRKEYLDVATKLTNEGKWVGGGMAEIGIPGIDCGGFVSILLTQSGFEPDYNYGLDMSRGASNQNGAGDSSGGQLGWAQRHWSFRGYGGEINTADLQPGDVAFSNGHTFIYVGEIEGFESQFASASYAWWRAPMAAGSWDGGFETATNPEYVWYGRREGTPKPYGSTNRTDPIPSGNNIHPGYSRPGGAS